MGIEEYNSIITSFWHKHNPPPEDGWRISTEIIQQGDKRWVRASIFYLSSAIVTAHSDDFDPQNTEIAEQQAIVRAIKSLPLK